MLKILWKRGEIAPDEQFHLLSTIFCYLMLDFYVKTGISFSLRDKRLFEIAEVEITKVDCIIIMIIIIIEKQNHIYDRDYLAQNALLTSIICDPYINLCNTCIQGQKPTN